MPRNRELQNLWHRIHRADMQVTDPAKFQRVYRNPIRKDTMTNYQLKFQYGITLEDYNRMLREQDFKCKICKTSITDKKKRRFHVDHNHVTGKVRGLLCTQCNFRVAVIETAHDAVEKYLKEAES